MCVMRKENPKFNIRKKVWHDTDDIKIVALTYSQ